MKTYCILSDSCGYISLATRIMTQIPEEDDPSQRQNKLNQEGDYQGDTKLEEGDFQSALR